MTYANWNAFDSTIWPRRSARIEALAHAIMRWSIPINVVASMGTFNSGLLSAEATYLQQLVALSTWGALIYASAFVRPNVQLEFNSDMMAVVGFYLFAVSSVVWTDLSFEAITKSVALAVTTFGAFCLITRVDIDDIVESTAWGLLVLSAASVCCSVLRPDIGVDQSWMHGGQWQGIFESKQTLGFVGAYLMFFACYRKMTGQNWLTFLIAFLLAGTCVIASGSRGAGALALVACGGLVLSLWSIKWMRFFAVLPFVMSVIASILILYLYSTGYDSFYVFNSVIDFTERTFIWQYALSHFDDAPLIGFGINGFWTNPAIYDYFEQNHGWVLDNYHNGYIAVLVETGFVGFMLFMAGVVLVSVKLLYLISFRSISRSHCALIVGFCALSFQLNFTETTFLRSTTFTSVLLVAFFLAVCRPLLPKAHAGNLD